MTNFSINPFLDYYNPNATILLSSMSPNIKELKAILHESIENIDDEEFLRTIKTILDCKYQSVSKPKLNDYQVKRIEKAKKSISKGETLTNEPAEKLVKRWLNG